MTKLVIILGVVLLSGTEVLAANLNLMGGVGYNNNETHCSSSSFTPTEITSTKASRNTTIQVERSNRVKLENRPQIVAQTTPSSPPSDPGTGTPDSRGGTR